MEWGQNGTPHFQQKLQKTTFQGAILVCYAVSYKDTTFQVAIIPTTWVLNGEDMELSPAESNQIHPRHSQDTETLRWETF